MTTKTCFKCGETKPRNEFYRHARMGDGRLNKCKDCTKADARETRQRRLGYYRAYDRKRGNRQGSRYVQGYRQKFPNKSRAHRAVKYAIDSGNIKRPDHCEECGDACTPHGHHDDYAKPLEVRWLCPACHRQWHIDNGEGLNADAAENESEAA